MGERVQVAIVGGGISGLSLASHLSRRRVTVSLLEGATRPGGFIHSERRDGYCIEWGPNGFLDNEPAMARWIDGFGNKLTMMPAGGDASRRWVVRGGKLRELPSSPSQIVSSSILSAAGRARLMMEWTQATRRDAEDESVWEFASRRFGREAADVLADAMVTGIYAGDARRTSVQATFPRLRVMEREHGGLLRALAASRKTADSANPATPPSSGFGGTLTSFAGGMESLVHAAAASLGTSLRCDALVTRVTRAGNAWRLEVEHGAPVEADHLVLACAPLQAAVLVRSLDHALAELLERLPTAPVAVVALGWHERDVAQVERGFGFLVPTRERLGILGTVFESWIFSDRAPANHALWRCMIGGARDRGAIDLDDVSLVQRALAALGKLLGVRATPAMTAVTRHVDGLPQYALGHLERMAQIDDRLARHPGLGLTGNAYRGISVNACVRESETLARRWGDDAGTKS